MKNRNYVEFGSGSRMATFKLWKGSELIKIQVNFVERLIFPHRNVIAGTPLAGKEISDDEKAYFEEFLEFHSPVKLAAYSLEEILCEKIRAILTRQAVKAERYLRCVHYREIRGENERAERRNS